jgi:hypothetical protein
MTTQNINATLSPSDFAAIKDALASIKAKLPFLVNLTLEERKGTFKAGPDSLSFLENALAAAKGYPAAFPADFSSEPLEIDLELFSVMTEVNTLLASLASAVDDTRVAIGGEAMQTAMQVYDYLKAASRITPGLKPVADQLGARFQKTRKAKAPKAQSA